MIPFGIPTFEENIPLFTDRGSSPSKTALFDWPTLVSNENVPIGGKALLLMLTLRMVFMLKNGSQGRLSYISVKKKKIK